MDNVRDQPWGVHRVQKPVEHVLHSKFKWKSSIVPSNQWARPSVQHMDINDLLDMSIGDDRGIWYMGQQTDTVQSIQKVCLKIGYIPIIAI